MNNKVTTRGRTAALTEGIHGHPTVEYACC